MPRAYIKIDTAEVIMAKTSKKQRIVTKKHQARVDRERRQTQLIMTISVIVLAAVIILVGYGILDQYVLQGLRPGFDCLVRSALP